MSGLRSAIDELRAHDVGRSPDRELESDLVEIERATRSLAVERARRIAEIERRGVYAGDGYPSVTSWLVGRFGIAPSAAVQHVRLGRSLEHMTATRRALEEGTISPAAALLLASAREADPDRFEIAERTLVDAASSLSVRELRIAVDRWRQLADAMSGDEIDARRFHRRTLHVSPTLDGMVRVDGDLDPETGQTVITALRTLQDVWSRSGAADARTPAQMRADALGEICRRYLDSSDRQVVAGERPHVTLTVDLETLERRAGRRCELEDSGGIGSEAARRLACDAGVTRVITRGESQPLDVGRRTAVVPTAIRRAVVVRDGGCRFPGCDRPPGWCDVHHVVHWADGGETSLANLVLLCRRHHRLVHDRFRMQVADGRLVFRRPDGTPLGPAPADRTPVEAVRADATPLATARAP